METQEDYRELFALWNAHDVQYIIVGAYALAFHSVPCYTGEIDIFVGTDRENAEHILRALNEFGFGSLVLAAEDFFSPNRVVQLGVPPVRVDILTSLTGVTWKEASRGRQPGFYGDIPVRYMDKNELLANKRALGRKRALPIWKPSVKSY